MVINTPEEYETALAVQASGLAARHASSAARIYNPPDKPPPYPFLLRFHYCPAGTHLVFVTTAQARAATTEAPDSDLSITIPCVCPDTYSHTAVVPSAELWQLR